MKACAILCVLIVATDAFAPAYQTRRAFGVVSSRGAEEGEVAEAEATIVEEAALIPQPEPEPTFQVLSPPIVAEDDGDGFTQLEKDQITETVFDCHGFFPDLRSESQLPESTKKMRDQPKSESELSAIKAKYATMSEADAAFSMLVDLGLMEDYDKLGEYSDDFDDEAM